MYIASPRAQFKINTHGCWNWHLCIPDGLSMSSAAAGISLGLWGFISHHFSGMKRTCWTTGSWQRCLSLEVVSSIPTRSTIICRFLCGFICVSLYQSTKLNQQICISLAQLHSSKSTHTDVWIVTCAFHMGYQLSSAASVMWLGLWGFFYTISVAWSEHVGQLATGGVASDCRSCVRSPPGPR